MDNYFVMIRMIVIPNKQTISFTIPPDYVGKQIEVIAFAKDEEVNKISGTKKSVSFTALSLDTKGYKFNRNKSNEQ